ncbi:Uncharacterised protein [Mycobacteroides abscessus]|nr:Uncharacterised protein [Mycobacteroides abscessus]CQA12052.1 Uncharacterised protein [Mycobacteroides abscessus]
MRAHALRQIASGRGVVGGDDGLDTQVVQGGDHGNTDGAATDDDRSGAQLDARLVDGMQADSHGFGQGRVSGIEAVGDGQQQRRTEQHLFGIAAEGGVAVDDGFQALGRQEDWN